MVVSLLWFLDGANQSFYDQSDGTVKWLGHNVEYLLGQNQSTIAGGVHNLANYQQLLFKQLHI